VISDADQTTARVEASARRRVGDVEQAWTAERAARRERDEDIARLRGHVDELRGPA
jgi:hypothetical protein